jgi:hypothetical protein
MIKRVKVTGHFRTHNDEEIIEVKGYSRAIGFTETMKRSELLASVKLGLSQGLDTTRGARMFGASAKVKYLGAGVLEIETREEGVTNHWRLKLYRATEEE